jgi:hypothetical protein
MKTIWATGLMILTFLSGSALAGSIANPKSADAGKPNYSISPAVKRDRCLPIDISYLKYHSLKEDNHGIWITEREEANWITERDGAMMLVDPHISQNLTRPLPAP